MKNEAIDYIVKFMLLGFFKLYSIKLLIIF